MPVGDRAAFRCGEHQGIPRPGLVPQPRTDRPLPRRRPAPRGGALALIGAFLDYLEQERGNSAATRNNRLAAIHSLFAYAALRCPEHAVFIQRVLAIPQKRRDSTIVSFLTRAEVDALLASPDRATYLGRRDHALLLVAVQTGLRVSELTGLTCGDVELGPAASLRCTGKGRKQR